jgi:AcrR family transcriptional regulator
MTAHRLSRDEFIKAAQLLFERGGASAITMRALGKELGVDPTAAYRHFENKDSIIMALLFSFVEEEFRELKISKDPEQRILKAGLLVRSVLMSYPELAVALMTATEAPSGPLEIEIFISSAIRELGYEGDELVRCYQAIESFVMGAVLFDSGSAPRNWEIRRQRYVNVGDPAFVKVGRSEASVERNTEAAFEAAYKNLVRAIARHELLPS